MGEMTYKELYEKAEEKLEKGEITCGEFDELTKPLDEEIRQHGEWVPCSERLPEETDAYLVTIDYGDGLSCAAVRYFWDEKRLWNEAEEYITAWMPIPKPYKRSDKK